MAVSRTFDKFYLETPAIIAAVSRITFDTA
jgi:hypothetical protein